MISTLLSLDFADYVATLVTPNALNSDEVS